MRTVEAGQITAAVANQRMAVRGTARFSAKHAEFCCARRLWPIGSATTRALARVRGTNRTTFMCAPFI